MRPEAFSRTLQGFFLREHAHFLAALVLCSLCVTASVLIMVSLSSGRGVTLLPWSAETTMVFLMGQIGYGLMALGMFSCMFMITLSQPWRAVNSVAAGITVTIVAGLAIGSALPYQYVTFGVVVGGLVFALKRAGKDVVHARERRLLLLRVVLRTKATRWLGPRPSQRVVT